jgi:hypothetical protein
MRDSHGVGSTVGTTEVLLAAAYLQVGWPFTTAIALPGGHPFGCAAAAAAGAGGGLGAAGGGGGGAAAGR